VAAAKAKTAEKIEEAAEHGNTLLGDVTEVRYRTLVTKCQRQKELFGNVKLPNCYCFHHIAFNLGASLVTTGESIRACACVCKHLRAKENPKGVLWKEIENVSV
jgi:hypothetical protein